MLISSVNIIQKKTQAEELLERIYSGLNNNSLNAPETQTHYYWLRWVNTRSEHGPWSSAISAMVAG